MNNKRLPTSPAEEGQIVDSLPERFSREEIMTMINNLRSDMAAESPPLAFKDRVYSYAHKYKELLYGMPFLYRTILKGTYRESVVKAILDARDAMESGVRKDKALEGLITRAVDEVNEIRESERVDTTESAP